MDREGTVHIIKLGLGGLVFLTLLKIASNILMVKWGMDAIKTFKPIRKEVEREDFNSNDRPQNMADPIKIH